MPRKLNTIFSVTVAAMALLSPELLAQDKEYKKAVSRLGFQPIWPPSNHYSLGGTFRPKDGLPMKSGCYDGKLDGSKPSLDAITIELKNKLHQLIEKYDDEDARKILAGKSD